MSVDDQPRPEPASWITAAMAGSEPAPLSTWCYRCMGLRRMIPKGRPRTKGGSLVRYGGCGDCGEPVYRVGGARETDA